MKKILIITVLTCVSWFSLNHTFNKKPIIKEIKQENKYIHIAEVVSKEESNNTNDTMNYLGMVGKYQLHPITLKEFGVHDTIINKIYKYKKHRRFPLSILPEERQDSIFYALLHKTETHYLKRSIKYDKKYHTYSLLYASLIGYKRVSDYILSNGRKNGTDANGQSVKYRLERFEKIISKF